MSVDFIIVGQGIAGTLLAHHLQKAGCEILIFDALHRHASSTVGAGIINPITGRRFVQAWHYQEHLEQALNDYSALEIELGRVFLHQRNILRTLKTAHDLNNWRLRSHDPVYTGYICEPPNLGPFKTVLKREYRYGEVTGSYQLDMPALLKASGDRWRSSGTLRAESFDLDNLMMYTDGIKYAGVHARGIVFCEGQQVLANPLFTGLPIGDSKGEILRVRIPSFRARCMLKQKYFIVPLVDDLFWFGSFDRWGSASAEVTTEGRKVLEQALTEMINLPFEIESHEAALRPTTPDRRPILGTHWNHKSIHLFNGLGTKGASLAPLWAKHMKEYLLEGHHLPDEVNLNRFLGKDGIRR